MFGEFCGDCGASSRGTCTCKGEETMFDDILEWYSGKAREKIVNYALPALAEAKEQGYWQKGAARAVRAALSKQNVAGKWARNRFPDNKNSPTNDDVLHSIVRPVTAKEKKAALKKHSHWVPEKEDGFYLGHAMMFGLFSMAPKNLELWQRLEPYVPRNDRALECFYRAKKWIDAFIPVAKLVDMLDSRRPKPTFVMKTLSPTVADNISKAIGVDVATIRIPPMHGEWVKRQEENKHGKLVEVEVYEIVIDWPKNTKHCVSRFRGTAQNQQCEACGHAIKNPFNWVPLLADTREVKSEGVVLHKSFPVSLWVGRDCAAKLFECEVTGDAVYKR